MLQKSFKLFVSNPQLYQVYRAVTGNRLIAPILNCLFKKYSFNFASAEYGYLDCVRKILDQGEVVPDRTGVGSIKISGHTISYPIKTIIENTSTSSPSFMPKIKYQIPVFTTKQTYFRGAICELLWMLRGGTNTKWLHENKVHIWDGNSSAEFLKKNNLDYAEGELGPVYGYQWTNWGGDWKSIKDPRPLSDKPGINQVVRAIDLLINNPSDRRIIIQGWNVSDLSKMALPPCHMTYLFDVVGFDKPIKTLNCQVIIRSNDMFLGHPFNVIGPSILVILLSRLTKMLPGKVDIVINNAHIYQNHVEQMKEQITRIPLDFPWLTVKKLDVNVSTTDKSYAKAAYDVLTNLEYSDFEVTDYKHWPKLTGTMAV